MAAYPHELSGGMGQRAMIAMMLVTEPDLLIADEPTSALDVTVQNRGAAHSRQAVSERGMGLIFISHDLELVSTFCDRVLVMYAGQVVEEARRGEDERGPTPLYKRPYRLPAQDQWRRPPAAGAGARCGLAGVDRDGADRHRGPGSHLRIGRRRVHALRGVSLTVEEGESFGIVGESGSGKSTVLRAACGLAPVTGGRILIDGKQVTSPRDQAFYRRVQMVFQDPYASLHTTRHTIDRRAVRAARHPRI